MFWVVYKRCRLEEPQHLPLFMQDKFSVEVCCGIIRALQSFQTQVENFPLETSFKLKSKFTIEENIENKICSATWVDPKTIFELYPNSKNSPLGSQKVKNDPKNSPLGQINQKMHPKLSQIQKLELKKT